MSREKLAEVLGQAEWAGCTGLTGGLNRAGESDGE